MIVAFIPMLMTCRGVLLPQPRRPGRRHDVLLGHARLRPLGGVDRRLGDRRRRHHRHGEPGRDRRDLHVPARSAPTTPTASARCSSLGVIWIAADDLDLLRRHRGLRATQYFLLTAEIVTLLLFAVVALWKVYAEDVPGSIDPSLSWFNPFAIDSTSALVAGLHAGDLHLLGLGLDRSRSTRRRKDATERPGQGGRRRDAHPARHLPDRHGRGVRPTRARSCLGRQLRTTSLGLLGTDVLGSPLDNLLIIAVLTSAAASTQTTILPTTRTTLSMAAKGAAPRYFARIHPRT